MHPWKQHSAFPNHPCLILLPVCQPLSPQRLSKTPSANCPLLAQSSQQTEACLSEGPRAACGSARATLRIVPYCICCARLAVDQQPDGKRHKKSGVQRNDEAKQAVHSCCHNNSHPIQLCLIITINRGISLFVLRLSQIDSARIFDNSAGEITCRGQFGGGPKHLHWSSETASV